jgi:DNA (cytosine-5)-methyltransferase 1
MNELALFAGSGGGILGGKLLGWRTVCAVEINEYCRERLMQRQNEGHLPPFPIWDDVRTFDGKPWRGLVDVISGGFPCQDISSQSSVYGNSDGLDGERSGLWSEFARLIGEIRPKHAFIENSPNLTFRGLDRIMCDLAALGHSARWGVVGANSAGLDHLRERIWIVTDNDGFRLEGRNNSNKERQGGAAFRPMAGLRQNKVRIDIPAPNAFGAANGLAGRVDRLKAVGNGQVPAVVKIVWRTLTNEKI